MRGNEMLEQMELVDPAYVEAADAAPKKKKSWGWVAAAAVLCFILCGWLLGDFLGVFPNGNGTYTPPPIYYVGDEVSSYFGTLIYRANDDENCTVSFALILKQDVPYNTASLRGYKYVPVEYEIIDGEKVVVESDYVSVYAMTPIDEKDYENKKEACDRLEITVDGKPATYLPTKAGTYEIQLDYSKLEEQCIGLNDYISFAYFGDFRIKPLD